MKKVVLLALAVVASASFCTVDAKKKKKEEVKAEEPVVVPVELKSGSDSVSYAAGMSVTNGLAAFLKQQHGVDSATMAIFIKSFEEVINAGDSPEAKAKAAGVDIANQLRSRMLPGIKNEFTDSPDSIISTLFYRGFIDAMKQDTTHFKQQVAENYFRQKQEVDQKAKEEKLYGPNRDAGIQFLKENAAKEGVITTASGLQYKVLVKGEGEVPQKTDKVLVNYEGRLVDGTVFDASAKHGDKPASFRADQVIKGWTEALTMMPVGSKWQLYIPQELAYGERNMGNIKPYSTLIFDVELVGIDKPKTAEPAKPAVSAKPATKKTAKK
ncbi:MAG: FKBP-type peptidyl-prolyl cis-trans isomerase [Bacteroidaceae bacterium]|nr:FKBP-type peptidyl-prolyl cis-trans isomerase [Bacteroidaceae bacterium]